MSVFSGGAVSIIAVVGLFIVLPKMIFSFISKQTRLKRETDLEKMKYQKEILELEIQKQQASIRLLEEENKKLDYIINGH